MPVGIPQQVKSAWVEDLFPGTVQTRPIKLELGPDEIAIVLASVFCHVGERTPQAPRMWLYKKGDEHIPSNLWAFGTEWTRDDQVIDFFTTKIDHFGDLGTTLVSSRLYKVYPYPITLIRSPSLRVVGEGTCSVGVWYLTERVSKDVLAHLMVKDHA